MAMIESPDGDAWETWARKVRDRRLELGYTQDEAAKRGGVSGTTWRKIEEGATTSYRALSLSGVCRALDWPPNAYLQILGWRDDITDTATELDMAVLTERIDDLEERMLRVEAHLRGETPDGRSAGGLGDGGAGEPPQEPSPGRSRLGAPRK